MTDEQSPTGELVAEQPKVGPNTGNMGKGRPKGSPNKTTAILKDAILLAAQRAGGDSEDGLVNYLQTQAQTNPGPFLSLLGKVLPMQIAGDNENPLFISVVERRVVRPNA